MMGDQIKEIESRFLFSDRQKIAEEVERWLDEQNASPHIFNVITALSALGWLRKQVPSDHSN